MEVTSFRKWSREERQDEGGDYVRETLKKARQEAGLTQKQVAETVGVSERHYKYIKAGQVVGNVDIWDNLEDLFNTHQRKLRELSATHHGREDSR